jgi:acetyltransferase
MGLYNLDKIFEPESIAVVGASEKEGSIGSVHVQNLIQGGYQGKIFPVNPHYTSTHGLKAYPSISRIDHAVDLAIIAIPISSVPSVIRECAQVRVGGAIVVSAGGKETGPRGREIEDRIRREAETGGLRIIGPNCLGIICPGRKLNASFAAHMPQSGKVAFISQSGAICTAILDLALKEEIGFSHFVSIGSMLDVDFGDLIDYLGNYPEVNSILLYIESLTNFRKFMSAARAVSRVKPIVVLKSGRSPAGARAAASHTGAMVGEDAVYDAAFKRAGIVRVQTFGELFDCAELMAKQPRPKGRLILWQNMVPSLLGWSRKPSSS